MYSSNCIIFRQLGFMISCVFSCVPVTCPDPEPLENADVTILSRNFSGFAFYICSEGYEMLGSDQLRCNASGQWELQGSAAPECRERTCEIVPVIEHATTKVETMSFGSKAEYVCNHGYMLRGVGRLECGPDGRWFPQGSTECVEIDCGDPPLVENSHRDFTSTGLGASVVYSCEEGYVLSGSDTLECSEDAQWEGDTPLCNPVR